MMSQPQLGQIKAGFFADLLVVKSNPLEDITVFERSETEILLIIKGGRPSLLLSFDVYGTLVDGETGIVEALQPFTREQLLTIYHELERDQQQKTPDMPYTQQEESLQFGTSIAHWPAFPDTVDALKRLSEHYRLVVLSNVDRESFAKTDAGSLQGFPFDLVITAQDVGSYKPDLRNFEYMLHAVRLAFDGISADQVLQTAQCQFHDHHPARKMEIRRTREPQDRQRTPRHLHHDIRGAPVPCRGDIRKGRLPFGEIGLDYDYLDRADKETQQRAFHDQLYLSVEIQLPLFLHVRNACADFISIIKPYLPQLPRGGLVHSFAGSKEEMLQLVDLVLEISVNGVCFHTDERLEMVRHIPLDRLHLETDAP
ncbi:hypothetical protein MPDQ_001923 [Monascus purpureus]|uniref:Amidohydrolase-related domain-containing protein n=1 Tax=Monascus purpureus TaxID=5098 RepID=A0A507QQN1_MONPU|nr:hypothetical protein MPDQ_001923 [Monascus purpureus]